MCPLVAAPNRGYADWQRVSNYDTGVLFSNNGGSLIAVDNMPLTDVSRYAYLGGIDGVSNGDCVAVFSWYGDAAGANLVGQREFRLSGSVLASARYRLPNLGPFLSVQWSQIGAFTFRHTCSLFLTNRVHPLEFIPDHPTFIVIGAQNLAAGTVQNCYPTDYYAGPMSLWCQATTGPFYASLQLLDATDVWVFLDQVAVPTTPGVRAIMIAPSGAWRIIANNTGGAVSNFYLAVTPSTTGAA